MTNDIWHIILYFFVYSVLGWVWETAYCSWLEKRFVYRGFLSGPYCPIYGFGVLLLFVVLTPLYEVLPVLFIVSFVVMSALEYATSYVLEKVFHQRWWDYSHESFNLHGRIALKSSLFWAVMSVIIVTLIQPQVVSLANFILTVGEWLPVLIVIGMLADAVHTTIRLAGMSRLVAELQRGIGTAGGAIADQLGHARPNGRPRFTERRLLKAFPHVFGTSTSNSKK